MMFEWVKNQWHILVAEMVAVVGIVYAIQASGL